MNAILCQQQARSGLRLSGLRFCSNFWRRTLRKSNFAVRLQPSLLEAAKKLAHDEGISVNQLINVALAEKLSALWTETHLEERASRGDPARAKAILARA